MNGQGAQPFLEGDQPVYLLKVDVLIEVEQNEECTFLENSLDNAGEVHLG